jgi:hypothetical protein
LKDLKDFFFKLFYYFQQEICVKLRFILFIATVNNISGIPLTKATNLPQAADKLQHRIF